MALEVAIKKYYPDFSLDVNFYTEKGILYTVDGTQDMDTVFDSICKIVGNE